MTDKSPNSKLANALIAIILTPIVIFTRMWVLVKLWAWYVVPFFGAPVMSMTMAYGTLLIAGFVQYRYTKPKGDSLAALIQAILFSLLTLALGYAGIWFTR